MLQEHCHLLSEKDINPCKTFHVYSSAQQQGFHRFLHMITTISLFDSLITAGKDSFTECLPSQTHTAKDEESKP